MQLRRLAAGSRQRAAGSGQQAAGSRQLAWLQSMRVSAYWHSMNSLDVGVNSCRSLRSANSARLLQSISCPTAADLPRSMAQRRRPKRR